MAITYTGARGLFTVIGEVIQKLNSYETIAENQLTTDLEQLQQIFEAAGKQVDAPGLIATFDSFRANVTSWRQTLAGIVDRVLVNRDDVLAQLKLTSASVPVVLAALIDEMADVNESVRKNTVTIGTIQANSENYGNGTVLTTAFLDGYTAPSSGMAAHNRYSKTLSELAGLSETMSLVCTADSQSDGRNEGQEVFSWRGQESFSKFDYRAEGSGAGPSVTLLHAEGILSNRDFETWASTTDTEGKAVYTANNWTIDNGDETNFRREDDSRLVHRGTYALRIDGTPLKTGPFQISNAITVSLLKPRRLYCLAFRYRRAGRPSSSGSASLAFASGDAGQATFSVLTVEFQGTGLPSLQAHERFVNSVSLSADWTLGYFFYELPEVIPSDFKLVVNVTGLDEQESIWIDSMAFGPLTRHNGIGLVMVAGDRRFVRGDRFQFTVTNDRAGLIQDFFRVQYGVQLPSSGSPTIDDALAASASG